MGIEQAPAAQGELRIIRDHETGIVKGFVRRRWAIETLKIGPKPTFAMISAITNKERRTIMSDQDTHKGGCFCGAVTVEVTSPPVAQGFCHCSDCRAWSAAPVTAYALFPAPAVKVTGGQDVLGEYTGATGLRRVHCQKCGGNVMSDITQAGLIDLYPSVIPTFTFTPEAHVNYAERMIDMKDGLPKFAKMPDPETGQGEMMEE